MNMEKEIKPHFQISQKWSQDSEIKIDLLSKAK